MKGSRRGSATSWGPSSTGLSQRWMRVVGFFRDMKDIVVGNSIVPDMVNDRGEAERILHGFRWADDHDGDEDGHRDHDAVIMSTEPV